MSEQQVTAREDVEALVRETCRWRTENNMVSWVEFEDVVDLVERVRAAERERLAAVVADVIADHRMWIGDDGQPLDYSPEREARIAEFCREVENGGRPPWVESVSESARRR